MGFLNSDSSSDNRSEQLIQEQLNMQKAELANKKASLFKTRLDIIKGQGAEVWEPDLNARAGQAPGGEGGGGNAWRTWADAQVGVVKAIGKLTRG